MTPAEELAEVRARLERMVALAEAADDDGFWWHHNDTFLDEFDADDSAFIAACRPNLLQRVAREALGVLNRHYSVGWGECSEGCPWPCPEVTAVLQAWQP